MQSNLAIMFLPQFQKAHFLAYLDQHSPDGDTVLCGFRAGKIERAHMDGRDLLNRPDDRVSGLEPALGLAFEPHLQ